MSSINCPNKKKILASFVTNGNDPARSSWDLTPYQTAGLAKPGSTWRIIETGAMLQYYEGKVSADGTLVSSDYEETVAAARSARSATPSAVPSSFSSGYSYDGYMELQIEEPPPEKECTTCPCPDAE